MELQSLHTCLGVGSDVPIELSIRSFWKYSYKGKRVINK